jgi:hypothetical protein
MMDMDVAWGGYYAASEGQNRPIRYFRLLDFSREMIHLAWYELDQEASSDSQWFLAASPSVGHAAIATLTLVEFASVTLLASQPLTETHLGAFREFLVANQIPPELIEEHFAKLQFFSEEPPLLARLELENGELVIRER